MNSHGCRGRGLTNSLRALHDCCLSHNCTHFGVSSARIDLAPSGGNVCIAIGVARNSRCGLSNIRIDNGLTKRSTRVRRLAGVRPNRLCGNAGIAGVRSSVGGLLNHCNCTCPHMRSVPRVGSTSGAIGLHIGISTNGHFCIHGVHFRNGSASGSTILHHRVHRVRNT